jgi:hypothetical protein
VPDKTPTTVVRLSRAVLSDGRMVDSLAFDGAPGSAQLPIIERDGEYELDALQLVSVMARRTGLSRPALERLPPADFHALAFALFLPRPRGELVSLDDKRKAKK